MKTKTSNKLNSILKNVVPRYLKQFFFPDFKRSKLKKTSNRLCANLSKFIRKPNDYFSAMLRCQFTSVIGSKSFSHTLQDTSFCHRQQPDQDNADEKVRLVQDRNPSANGRSVHLCTVTVSFSSLPLFRDWNRF